MLINIRNSTSNMRIRWITHKCLFLFIAAMNIAVMINVWIIEVWLVLRTRRKYVPFTRGACSYFYCYEFYSLIKNICYVWKRDEIWIFRCEGAYYFIGSLTWCIWSSSGLKPPLQSLTTCIKILHRESKNKEIVGRAQLREIKKNLDGRE